MISTWILASHQNLLAMAENSTSKMKDCIAGKGWNDLASPEKNKLGQFIW